jgi:rRNA biogenesis protein RRP5
LVLGQVCQINRYDIALALPNNLTGYIPLTSISATFTEVVEAIAQDEATDEKGDVELLDLRTLFYVGQYLRAYVVSTLDEAPSGRMGRRHIELSIDPRKANSGLSKADIVVNSMIQASVSSVEDYGVIMNLGLDDTGLRGFMSSKELGHNVSLSNVRNGMVFLCLVTGLSSNGNIIKLSADPGKVGNIKKGHFLTDAPSVDAFLPGTAVEVLVSEVTGSGVVGKVMGMLDVTADLIHSGAATSENELEKRYKPGSKIKTRVICTFPTVEKKKIGVSMLDHVVSLTSKTSKSASESLAPTEILPISTVLEETRVKKIIDGVGLFVDVGVEGVDGFVHISKIADEKIETLPESIGPYKLDSIHKARIIGYNPMDGLFIVSLEPKVINQQFLRIEDVKVGQTVLGMVEKLIVDETGVTGILVNIADGISGLVPKIHFADITLQHPERKFKIGSAVKARVLSTHPEKRQLRLTLKKALVNSGDDAWDSYENLKPGLQATGTLVNILSTGAIVQFFGSVRGFLPVSEMSESYIEDPNKHFRIGQVVHVRIVSLNAEERKMIVSCKDATVFDAAKAEELSKLEPGSVVEGTVSEKTNDEIIVELNGSGLKALLAIGHLADGSNQKCLSLAKRIRVSQVLRELVVLNKNESKRIIRLTSKPSLVKAAKEGKLLKSFDDVVEGAEFSGFVNNTTLIGCFVEFAAGVTGLLPKAHMADEAIRLPDFGMTRHQSITCRVFRVDHAQQRFQLTLRPIQDQSTRSKSQGGNLSSTGNIPPGALDKNSTLIHDFTFGSLTTATVTSVKETQINVKLDDGLQGRIDVSEVFDTWEDIKDRTHPLQVFCAKQVLPVRVLGTHDSRNHRFLPITHRDKAPVFELTAKPSNLNSSDLPILTLDKVEIGSSRLVFVNNISENCIWVNLSPNVRGRITAMDISDDVSLLDDLEKNFPIGSALRAKVTKVDLVNNRIDLSARMDGANPSRLDEISKGMILPGRVTKVMERQIMVQLSEQVSGPINMIDLADDYSEADPSKYQKNQIIRVCVKDVDCAHMRITMSTRPSRVLSSSLPVKDLEIDSVSQLKVNDILRGFVKNVADAGLFVHIGSTITAFVRVSDLSDLFLKDWKSHFAAGQLVRGKVIGTDSNLNHVQLSLRQSHLDADYKAPVTFADMEVGKVVTGKVRKVEDYGVFIVVDGSINVSGLCHRSELADKRTPSPKKLYAEGDAVKAKVLKIDPRKKHISFGLKASYFKPSDSLGDDLYERDDGSELSSNEEEHDDKGPLVAEEPMLKKDVLHQNGNESEMNEYTDNDANIDADNGVSLNDAPNDSIPTGLPVLDAGGFDWTGGVAAPGDDGSESGLDLELSQPKKKRRRKAEIKIDRTGDLDANGPQSTADFERLLMGQPNSSVLWVTYMAFQLQLSEVGKAREIAERAIRTINMREEAEKLNVWVALLNLENTYGSDESLEEVFKRACQYNDSEEMHERLISIYIQSGKNEVSQTDDFHPNCGGR